MRRVLVVDGDETVRRTLQLKLRSEGFEAVGVDSLDGARREAGRGGFALVVYRPGRGTLPPRDAGADGLGGARLVVVLPRGTAAAPGLEAVRAGADDFVVEGDDLAGDVALAVAKAGARLEAPARGGPPPAATADSALASDEMVGGSPDLARLQSAIRRVAPFKTTVLVRGESGTGKELVARALHRLSPRVAAPFVAVNCGAIPAGLMESELFGHVKGTFTDALRDRQGLLEQAHGGTLFLDEIAELPLELQVKLLRVLEDDRVRRLGDVEDRSVDVRLVAATAKDLEAEVAAGRFRQDLFHRLDVVALRLPALRDRAGDVPLLAAHFMTKTSARLGLALHGIAPEAMRLLAAYPWPGNVRELENTIERAAVMAEGPTIDVASLPERLLTWSRRAGLTPPSPSSSSSSSPSSSPDEDLSIKRAARRGEEDLIRRALARTGGNRTRAAELLDISHRALLYKIKEYGIATD